MSGQEPASALYDKAHEEANRALDQLISNLRLGILNNAMCEDGFRESVGWAATVEWLKKGLKTGVIHPDALLQLCATAVWRVAKS